MMLRFAAAIALSVLAAACSDTVMDPPQLYLEPPLPTRPSNLPPGDLVITNGQAEVLMEAPDLKPKQEHSANFDPDKLDGILNVLIRRGDDFVYRQTLRHTPGVPVSLRWDINLARFELTEVPPKAPGSKTGGDGGGGGRD
jgi:hypothetical protein